MAGYRLGRGHRCGWPSRPVPPVRAYRHLQGCCRKLLEAGYAYESFSTPEEIKERNLAAGRPAEFGYDGYDRNLTDEQKAAFRAEGRKPALRIKMPDEDIAFDDLIRGTIEFKAGSVPDYVIVRPNGDHCTR